MQTFLPFPQFDKSADCLDRLRLGKQRCEAKQLYQCLTGQGSTGWRNHPAAKMWKGYEKSLLRYSMAICEEWLLRGYRDTLYDYFYCEYMGRFFSVKYENPPWLGNEEFHLSHQSNLLRKKFDHYQLYFNCSNDLPYIWPKGKE